MPNLLNTAVCLELYKVEANTVGPPDPWVPYPQIQPNMDWKYSEKKFQKVPKSKTWICHMPTTIYIALTVYLVL